MMVQGNPIADAKAARARAHLDDNAGGFMAEYARRRNSAVMDFLDVGGTDAAGGDLDQQLAGLDLRDRQGFEAEVIRAAKDGCLHGLGKLIAHSRKLKVRGVLGQRKEFVDLWVVVH